MTCLSFPEHLNQRSHRLFTSLLLNIFKLHLCICVHKHSCAIACVWSEDSFQVLALFPSLSVSQGWNSASQAWWQAPISTEPSCLPYFCLLNTFYFYGICCVKMPLRMCLLTVRTPQVKTRHWQLANPSWTTQPIPLHGGCSEPWNCGS